MVRYRVLVFVEPELVEGSIEVSEGVGIVLLVCKDGAKAPGDEVMFSLESLKIPDVSGKDD